MTHLIVVSDEELELLKQHKQKASSELIRDRAHAAILFSKGYSQEQVEDIFDRDTRTVSEWITHFTEIRIASIFHEYSNNKYNASKLTEKQIYEIKTTLQKQIGEGGALPKEFFDVSTLKEYVSATYGVVYESERSYHHLFEISNYSFKLPEQVNKRRADDETVHQRMLELQGIITDYQKQNYSVFFADECSLSSETESRKLWLPKGQKVIMRVTKDKQRQNYFGAWNIETNICDLISLDWQNTETMIGALEELTSRHPHRKILIIWDNARWHRSKELRELLGEGNAFSHIRLEWLPPYCPDYNPQEHVWKAGKDSVKNKVTETFAELKKIFEDTIVGRKFEYKWQI